MTYALGIDVGTSYTAAAVWRPGELPQNKAEVAPLGAHTPSVSTVLFLAADGSVVVGEAAGRRALTDPDRVVREFKRRIGDDTPLIVAGEPHTAHELAATMVCWVVDRVSEREGGRPEQIAITHPAAWGPYKKDLLRDALHARGLTNLTFLAEPAAAAISYASLERVEPETTIAVYDLGGGTFDAAVVRKTASGSFALLGTPQGLDQLGGVDFDEAVLRHVQGALATEMADLDVEDPGVLSGLVRLRRECTEAKEALSADTEVFVPVLLPGINSQIRLVRSEFEDMIRPDLEETVEALVRAIESAELTSDDLGAVLLVGGSSRMPLVAQMVSAELGCPVVVDADPKTTIALGAALSLVPPDEQPTAVIAQAAQSPSPAPAAGAAGAVGPDQTAVIPPAVIPPAASGQIPDHVPDQAPHRPPVGPAQQEVLREWAANHDEAARRKLVLSGVFAAIVIALVTGALLLPSLTERTGSSLAGTDRTPSAGGAVSAGSAGGAGGGADSDADKMSAAGGLLAQGRDETPEQTPSQGGAADPNTAAAAPAGAQGGRVTPPPAAPASSPAPAPSSGNAAPPPPPPTNSSSSSAPPPPPPTSNTSSEPPPPPPPNSSEPPPTAESEPAPTTEPSSTTSQAAETGPAE